MTTVAAVRSAMSDACATVSGLHATAYVADQINPPQAIVGTVDFDPRMVMGEGKCARRMKVTVYVNRTAEIAGQKLLDTYCELSGSSSLIAALQNNTALNALVDYLSVTTVRGPLLGTVGTIDYLILEIDVEVVF